MIRTVAAALLAACIALPAAAQTKWVMASAYADANFHTRNLREFIADAEAGAAGKLQIQLHTNASLLPMPQIKRAVQSGQVQMGEILLSVFGAEDPFFEVDSVPFLAEDWAASAALMTASEEPIRARMQRQGLEPLYWVNWPSQGFYTRTPLTSLDELRGARLRTYNAITVREALRAAAGRAATRGLAMAQEAEKATSARLAEKGMVVAAPSPALMAQLREVGAKQVQDWLAKAGPDGQQMLDRYRAAQPK
jgi:TRAP-type transport system periplasmic protein